ncbi:hypothetical protein AJ80_01387 [Polytolypa hystricis UAMH7299]|uniref:Uncharacterized protein n=1 Tax=Polytolypa hystricis (strain UAMH7299) TaxID=1447883 RepID=A0A2B7Z184_POLH7|nr:hypothetical protein AJ80_01387 [Polytolypa hystricis UAMH7299]
MSTSTQHTTGFATERQAGTESKPTQQQPSGNEPTPQIRDPFASQRPHSEAPFSPGSVQEDHDLRETRSYSPYSPLSETRSRSRESEDRRLSREWDASKVKPSQFQKRKGSIFSTAGSRDNHLSRKDRDALYHAKLKEKVRNQ